MNEKEEFGYGSEIYDIVSGTTDLLREASNITQNITYGDVRPLGGGQLQNNRKGINVQMRDIVEKLIKDNIDKFDI